MVGQPIAYNFNTAATFLGGNMYKDGTYTNSTGSSVTIPKGRVMGCILATALLLPQVAAATDGSEMPIGVSAEEYVVANGASVTLTYCYTGDIAQDMIVLNGAETLDTVIRTVSTGGATIGNAIQRNTDIRLIPTTQLAGYDNAL